MPPTWVSTLTQLTSSCAWQKKTGRWLTPHPGSIHILMYLRGLRTGAKCSPQRASIWGGTTLRQTSAARAHTLVWPTRALTARAARATAASQETTSPGASSGMAAPSPPGTATWKPLWMWRSSLASGFMWTTQEASWRSMVWMKWWRPSTSTRQSSWSLFTQLSGCPRRRISWPWWLQGSHYGSKALLLPRHLQTELLCHKQQHSNGFLVKVRFSWRIWDYYCCTKCLFPEKWLIMWNFQKKTRPIEILAILFWITNIINCECLSYVTLGSSHLFSCERLGLLLLFITLWIQSCSLFSVCK